MIGGYKIPSSQIGTLGQIKSNVYDLSNLYHW
jgi:hypothetical protein